MQCTRDVRNVSDDVDLHGIEIVLCPARSTAFIVTFYHPRHDVERQCQIKRIDWLGVIPVLRIATQSYFEDINPHQENEPRKNLRHQIHHSLTLYLLPHLQFLQRLLHVQLVQQS
jgi:hypothetical protein